MPFDPITVVVERDLKDLMPVFLEQRRKDQAAIAQALQADDFEALRKIGHGMAGGGRSYGFSIITDIGEAMVAAARARDSIELQRLAACLKDYLGSVTVKYV
ncbi:MAG: Hpt domain-containing protein [Burkholderiales bacterium]